MTAVQQAPEQFSAQWLMAQEFPPLQYVVPGIAPEGCSLLVAAPKVGKSWMVLDLALVLSTGGDAFGCLPVGGPRPVLYLALEDSKRRLLNRLVRLGAIVDSDRLQFIVKLGTSKVLDAIHTFLNAHVGEDPVVILDTLGKVMPTKRGNKSQYAHDYETLSALKALTDAVPGSSLIVVHHTRKADGGDFLDAVSGTQGIAGAADTVLVLKRERHDNQATLEVTSRDAEEGEYSLTMTDTGAWILNGDSLADAARAAQNARTTEGLGKKSVEIIDKINEYTEGIRARDLKVLLPHLPAGTIDAYLKRALETGRISRGARGLYSPISNTRSESFPGSLSFTSSTSYRGDKGRTEPARSSEPADDAGDDL